MTAPTQLSLYNGALPLCSERKLASLSDDGESLRTLNDVWADGFLDKCLEQGWWKHAMRTVSQTFTTGVALSFGYTYGKVWPTDLVTLYQISTDERFSLPLLNYYEQGRTWYCDFETVYIRYVSNDAIYGASYALWPESYRNFVHHALAFQVLPRLADPKVKLDDLERKLHVALLDARSKDAMKDPTKFLPESSWPAARRGRGPRYRDPYTA